jgi:hypothetical protein
MKLTTFIFKKFVFLALATLIFSCEKEENDATSSEIDTLISISENTTLDASKTYVVLSAVQVHATLVVPEGTVIKFYPSTRIDVHADGAVIANGTAAKPIVFTSIKDDSKGGDTNGDKASTSPAPKDWGCITNWGKSSVFTYCGFYYGGGYGDHTATLDIINCKAKVNFCTFAYNFGGLLNDNTNGALSIKEADYDIDVKNNVFYANDIPICIHAEMSMDTTNIFHNPKDVKVVNKFNGIFVDYNISNGGVVWQENEVPFVIVSILGIESTSSLTLNSDVVLKMYPQTRIDIMAGGTLNHNGAIITSFKDDTSMGDTNGDGTLTSAAVGDWVGINLGYGNYMTGSNIKYAEN